MQHQIKYLVFILVLLLNSCYRNRDNNQIEKVLQELTDKFPQLPKEKNKLTELYKLKRTVIIGEKNIEIQLRSSPDSIDDYQQVIVVRNPQNEYYAIPFFSNTYRDYWNFEFDEIDIAFKTNTTFEDEFNKAMEMLNLHDTIGTKGNVQSILFEIFGSLLICPLVELNDSSEIRQVSWSSRDNYSKYLDNENSDSCAVRKQKNFEDIAKAIRPSKYFFNGNTFWDKDNNRIYQIYNNSDMRQKTKYVLKLKTYRQDCVCQPIIL